MSIMVGKAVPALQEMDFFKEKKEIAPSKGFAEILNNTINNANQLKKDADAITNDFVAGKTDNLHEVMIAAQKSEIAISFVVEVRNRLVEAYQEFTRMQL